MSKIDKQSKSIKPGKPARGGVRPGAGRPKGSQNKVTIELSEAAQAYTVEALATLHKVCTQGESESARVTAACALLDRAYGKPKQQIDMSVDGEKYVVGVEKLPTEEAFDRKHNMAPAPQSAPNRRLN